jgi:hypothetical protein
VRPVVGVFHTFDALTFAVDSPEAVLGSVAEIGFPASAPIWCVMLNAIFESKQKLSLARKLMREIENEK